jgi:hypothetical protein
MNITNPGLSKSGTSFLTIHWANLRRTLKTYMPLPGRERDFALGMLRKVAVNKARLYV